MKRVTDFYPFRRYWDDRHFLFKSIGTKGVFNMAVVFEATPELNRYNLALVVIMDGAMKDDVMTNNGDFSKILMTVAACLEVFLDEHPNAIIEIGARGEKRLRAYNGIFQRESHEILLKYQVNGIEGTKKEPYNPGKFYQSF